jgi:hypothetical protein
VLAHLRIVWTLDYKQIRLYYSGRKGIHLLVPAQVLGIEPQSDLHRVLRAAAGSIKEATASETLDLKIYDRRRLFRMPQSIHEVSKRFKIPLLAEEVARMSEDEIIQLSSGPRRIHWPAPVKNSTAALCLASCQPADKALNKNKPAVLIDFDPPCVMHLLEHGAEQGGRNLATAALADHLKRRGYSEEETVEILIDWNGENSPPLHQEEILRTAQSMYRSNYSYGCGTFEQFHCEQGCPIYQSKR